MTPLAPLNELIDWGGWVAPSGGSDAPLYATESDRAEGYLTTGRSRTRPLSGVFRSSPFFPLSVSPSRMRRGGTGSLRMVRGSRSVQVLRQQRKSPGRRDGGQVPGRRLTFRTGKSRLQQRPVAEYQFPEDVVRGGFTAQCAGDARRSLGDQPRNPRGHRHMNVGVVPVPRLHIVGVPIEHDNLDRQARTVAVAAAADQRARKIGRLVPFRKAPRTSPPAGPSTPPPRSAGCSSRSWGRSRSSSTP